VRSPIFETMMRPLAASAARFGSRAFSVASTEGKAVLVRGGTIVNADREFRADVLSVGEKIVEVGENLTAPAGLDTEVRCPTPTAMRGALNQHRRRGR
jgi:hypothetical protein